MASTGFVKTWLLKETRLRAGGRAMEETTHPGKGSATPPTLNPWQALALTFLAWLGTSIGQLFALRFLGDAAIHAIGIIQLIAFGLVIFAAPRLFPGATELWGRQLGEQQLWAPRLSRLRADFAFPPMVLIGALLFGIGLQFPLAELGNQVAEVAPMSEAARQGMLRLLSPNNAAEAIALVFAVVLVAPLMEELLFRGVILTGLDGQKPSERIVAVVYSAIFFGAVHGAWVAAVPAFVAGLVLGLLRLRFGLGACVAMHAAVNATPVVIALSGLELEGLTAGPAGATHLPVWAVAIGAKIAGLGAVLLWKAHRSLTDI